VLLPFLVETPTFVQVMVLLGIETSCFALLAAFWFPPATARWAFRLVALLVFAGYAAYFVHEFFFTDDPVKVIQSRAEASPRNAFLGLIIIGIPCLIFAIFGRFTLRKDEESDEELMALESDAQEHPNAKALDAERYRD
jgi:hypothetical protein